jgi:hypothetical protein
MRPTIPILFFAACFATYSPAALSQNEAQGSASAQAGAGFQAGGVQAGANANTGSSTTVQTNRQAAQASSSSSTTAGAHAHHANQRDSQTENQSGPTTLAGGSTLNTELISSLDAKKNKPGDPVRAKSTKPAKCSDGEAIPKGSMLLGHVTQVQARGKGQSESAIGIAFDNAILKNGQEVPLNNLTIQALASTQTAAAASASMVDDSKPLGASAGASSGGRAAAGALGGLGGTVGGVTNATTSVGGTASGVVNSTASTTGAVSGAGHGATGGLDTAGQLTSNSRGVFGMSGAMLQSATSTAASADASAIGSQSTLVTSTIQNVHLDSGTQLLLVASGSAQAVSAR